MSKDYYVYPAVFTYDKDGIAIEFPDFPGCFSCADNDEEALQMAKEALALHISSMEEDGIILPKPTPVSAIKLSKNQTAMLIEVWLPLYREKIKVVSVKKTLTIPRWLNDLAEKHKVNFSQLLQNALKDHLGLKEKRP